MSHEHVINENETENNNNKNNKRRVRANDAPTYYVEITCNLTKAYHQITVKR